MEAPVVAELESLPQASQRPALATLAKVLARDLDDQSFAASHPALSRELRNVLGELRHGVRSQGKLAAVQALSAKRQ
jgi:predicted protein tyrosine phosphatase